MSAATDAERSARQLEATIRAGARASEQALSVIGALITNQVKVLLTRPYPPPSEPGEPPHLRTGGLRQSYRYEVTPGRGRTQARVVVYSDKSTLQPVPPNRRVIYACVFGAHTQVPTADGIKTIGQVRVGDRVLTATGEWREVLTASRFPVSEKPDLVTLRAPWRAGKDHELTVTTDHKVAIQRDGRVLWVPAGLIQPGDCVFQRRKLAHNKKVWEPLWCQRCGAELPDPRNNRQRRYCFPCAKWVAAEWHRGRVRGPEARRRMSEAAVRRGAGRLVNRAAALVEHRGRSRREVQVAAWLDERGVAYEESAAFGRFRVDFWVPESIEIYEADGAYWHRDQAKDIRRDQELVDLIPGVRITHVHFHDERWTPVLDPAPLPDVRYEIVNPSPTSFVEPDNFRAVPVEAEHWTWKPRGGPTPMLYDLAVDGIHSFVAAGLLISNSYLELGTSKMRPRPHLRPAVESVRPMIPGLVRVAWERGQRTRSPRVR